MLLLSVAVLTNVRFEEWALCEGETGRQRGVE